MPTPTVRINVHVDINTRTCGRCMTPQEKKKMKEISKAAEDLIMSNARNVISGLLKEEWVEIEKEGMELNKVSARIKSDKEEKL